MILKQKYQIHFIDEATDEVIRKWWAYQVPRYGDHLRFAEDVYYKVTLVVWIYDENDTPYSRVNIGISQEF